MNSPTICILTSGLGTRMGKLGEIANKAILPLNNQAIISHIISKFPPNSEFIISLGYKANQVQNYISTAHPHLNVEYVQVDKYEGLGSGPGYSLYCCKDYLQKDFFFVSCDTLWSGEIPFQSKEDWFAVASVPDSASPSFCNFKIKDNIITEIFDKQLVSGPDYKAFTGLCYIHSYELFWKSLGSTKTNKGSLVNNELQISNGLQDLIKHNQVKAITLDWLDVGNQENYEEARGKYEDYNFSKTNEFFYIVDNHVIKFFADSKISELRVTKAQMNAKVFPKIELLNDQFYSYKLVPGEVLYNLNSPEIFSSFLHWLKKDLWHPVKVDSETMIKACHKFYHNKTMERLNLYLQKYPNDDRAIIVNGQQLPSLKEVLDKLPWKALEQGNPVFMHGDLQFDNVIYNKDNSQFILIDWRQDFAGHTEMGDWYYDLAKLYGGILMNYDFIKKNLIWFDEDKDKFLIDFATRHLNPVYEKILFKFIEDQGLDSAKVKLLTGLIYLNMSPLHHYPFDKILWGFGRGVLCNALGLIKSTTND